MPVRAGEAARRGAVRAHWRELLPTAHLLTGDPAAAAHLVVRTLARTRLPAGAPHRDAVTALVGTHRRRWRPSGEGRIAAELPAPWWAAPQDVAAARDLAGALDALDRDQRTAVVLRWFEGWDADQVTGLLPAVDLDALAAQLPSDLPHRLDVLAGLGGTQDLDDDAVVAEVRRATGRRTRRAALAVAAAGALVAAAVWVPTTLPAPADPGSTTPPSGSTRAAEPVPPRGIYALPPRGALAGIADLVTGLQDRLTAEGMAGADHHVVYGEDVDGVRAVLMARAVGPTTQLAWLTGPAGTDPADLDVTRGDASAPAGAAAAAVTVPRPGGDGFVLVALSGVDDVVRVSPGIDVDPVTGAAGRAFVDLPGVDGTATGRVDRSSDAGVQLQVLGPAFAVQVQPTSVAGHRADPDATDQDPLPSRSGATTASAAVVRSAVSTVAAGTGWAPRDLDVAVLGSGLLTGPDGHLAQVAAVAAVLPSGAVVTTTAALATWTEPDGSTVSQSWTTCGSSGHPAGTDLAELVVAATCTFDDGAGGQSRVAVVAAPPGHRVVLAFAGGDAPLEPVLTDGFGVVPDLPSRGLATATDGGSVVPVAGPGQDVLNG